MQVRYFRYDPEKYLQKYEYQFLCRYGTFVVAVAAKKWLTVSIPMQVRYFHNESRDHCSDKGFNSYAGKVLSAGPIAIIVAPMFAFQFLCR